MSIPNFNIYSSVGVKTVSGNKNKPAKRKLDICLIMFGWVVSVIKY